MVFKTPQIKNGGSRTCKRAEASLQMWLLLKKRQRREKARRHQLLRLLGPAQRLDVTRPLQWQPPLSAQKHLL